MSQADNDSRYCPSPVVRAIILGILNAWTIDYFSTPNQLRDRSLQVRNVCSETFSQYKKQLRTELSTLQAGLPKPTRENPYPSLEGIEEIKKVEAMIQKVEAIQTKIQTASIPPNLPSHFNKDRYQSLLMNLYQTDLRLLRTMESFKNISDLEIVEAILSERNQLVQVFTMDLQ